MTLKTIILVGILICPIPAFAQTPTDPTALQQIAEGDALVQSILGDMYRKGEGVPQDYRLAAIWFRKAAEQRAVF